jgi:hypothetical protein
VQPTDATADPWRYPSDSFWDRYVASLRAKQVKPTAIRWYVIRAEHYLQAMSPKRLAEHTPQDVTDYLEKLGRIGRMTDWQYGQTVDAIQNLFVVEEITWAQPFDWAYWKASARTLPANHPTIARETAPVRIRGTGEAKPLHRVNLTRIRDTHAAILDQLRVEIRRRKLDTYGTGV